MMSVRQCPPDHLITSIAVFGALVGAAVIFGLESPSVLIAGIVLTALTHLSITVWSLKALGVSKRQPTPVAKGIFANLVVVACLVEVIGREAGRPSVAMLVLVAQMLVVEPLVILAFIRNARTARSRMLFEDI
jgi:hypothetical protein